MSYISFRATNGPADNMTPFGRHVNCLIFSPILTKFGSSRQIFSNVPNNKFHRYPSSDSFADTREQTDGRDEANRRFSRP